MSYIIVWRNNTRDPFINYDSHGFIEDYPSFEMAKESADEIEKNENENGKSEWYFNYKIYKEC
jgi:hypothetical protein